MEKFDITHREQDSISIFTVTGYFTQLTGEQLRTQTDAHLTREKAEMIIDFSQVLVINSPGVAGLLDLVLHIVDDLEGAVYLVGLDRLKNQVLTMAGIIPLATSVDTIDEAIQTAKG